MNRFFETLCDAKYYETLQFDSSLNDLDVHSGSLHGKTGTCVQSGKTGTCVQSLYCKVA